MANKTDPTDIDPKEYERSQQSWAAFTTGMKWSVLAIAALLMAMALVFIK